MKRPLSERTLRELGVRVEHKREPDIEQQRRKYRRDLEDLQAHRPLIAARAFTIWQPWASLIMIGAKPWEFRGRPFTQYSNAPAIGDRIVIHAGARPVKPAEIEDLLKRIYNGDQHTGLEIEPARQLLLRVRAAHQYRLLPIGAALGTAIVGKPELACDVFKMKVEDSDRGDFNWAWPLTDPRPFDAPIPMRGFQGFWNYPERIAA